MRNEIAKLENSTSLGSMRVNGAEREYVQSSHRVERTSSGQDGRESYCRQEVRTQSTRRLPREGRRIRSLIWKKEQSNIRDELYGGICKSWMKQHYCDRDPCTKEHVSKEEFNRRVLEIHRARRAEQGRITGGMRIHANPKGKGKGKGKRRTTANRAGESPNAPWRSKRSAP